MISYVIDIFSTYCLMIKNLDQVDAQILLCLSDNARIPTAELARRVGMSSPSVSDRLKRLEEAGVIAGYRAVISPAALGRLLTVWLRIRPVPGEMQRVTKIVQGIPEISQCDRVTGDDCFLAKAHVGSVEEMERIIDRIIPYAMTNTSVVQSSPVEQRLPPLGV
jgi:Lrp/AsnC family leucine-responsive transcriptional regulator